MACALLDLVLRVRSGAEGGAGGGLGEVVCPCARARVQGGKAQVNTGPLEDVDREGGRREGGQSLGAQAGHVDHGRLVSGAVMRSDCVLGR